MGRLVYVECRLCSTHKLTRFWGIFHDIWANCPAWLRIVARIRQFLTIDMLPFSLTTLTPLGFYCSLLVCSQNVLMPTLYSQISFSALRDLVSFKGHRPWGPEGHYSLMPPIWNIMDEFFGCVFIMFMYNFHFFLVI